MIFGFLNNTPSVSYHVREPEPNSGFLKGLVDNGVFKQDLFLPKVDIIELECQEIRLKFRVWAGRSGRDYIMMVVDN